MGTPSLERQNELVLALLRHHALRLSVSFDLPLRAVYAEGPRVRRRYGICYSDGTIKIRLRSVRDGQLLRESSLVDTLCHELAHLRYFDHGARFEKLYRRILEYARRHGIYRPGQPPRWQRVEPEPAPILAPRARPPELLPRPQLVQPRPARPVQLELF